MFTLSCVCLLSLINHTQKSLGPEIQVRQKGSYHDMYNWHIKTCGRFMRWSKPRNCHLLWLMAANCWELFLETSLQMWSPVSSERDSDIPLLEALVKKKLLTLLGQNVSWELHKVNLGKDINSFSDARWTTWCPFFQVRKHYVAHKLSKNNNLQF